MVTGCGPCPGLAVLAGLVSVPKLHQLPAAVQLFFFLRLFPRGGVWGAEVAVCMVPSHQALRLDL